MSATVAAELHDEFLASRTPGGAGRPVESMVCGKIGTAVMVRGLHGPAIVIRVRITREVRRWGSPEVGIGRVALLHGIESSVGDTEKSE